MSKRRDVVIIGGGLAGLTAAIHLALKGQEVTIIEKNKYPKHKVCGEYISKEVLPYFNKLGIYPKTHGAKTISRFLFSNHSGASLEISLPLGGFGISRYAIDQILYDRAKEVGVTFIQANVKTIQYENNSFKVTTRDNHIETTYVLGAYGKRSGIDVTLSRKFIKNISPWLAVKAHYEADFPEDLVALHNFNGGYCGLSKVETGAVNACYLADYKTFKKYKDLNSYQKEVLEKNKHLKDFFRIATPLFEKPLTISQIFFQNKSTVENHILMIGDSAGLIHPLCGNGMAMAIHSAKIASESLLHHIHTNSSRAELEITYTTLWKKTFTKRMRNGAMIQKGLFNKNMTRLGVSILQKSPQLLKKVITSTHGTILSDEF